MAAAFNGSEFFELEIHGESGVFARPSNAEALEEEENELLWAAIERLPSQKRSTTAFLRRSPSEKGGGNPCVTETIDVRKLDRTARELLVKKALATNDQDNYRLLSAIKERLDRYFWSHVVSVFFLKKKKISPRIQPNLARDKWPKQFLDCSQNVGKIIGVKLIDGDSVLHFFLSSGVALKTVFVLSAEWD